jgi:hypothetical protein
MLSCYGFYAGTDSSGLRCVVCKNNPALPCLQSRSKKTNRAGIDFDTEPYPAASTCKCPVSSSDTASGHSILKASIREFLSAVRSNDVQQLWIYRILQRPCFGRSRNSWGTPAGAAFCLIWGRKYLSQSGLKQARSLSIKAGPFVLSMGNAGQ